MLGHICRWRWMWQVRCNTIDVQCACTWKRRSQVFIVRQHRQFEVYLEAIMQHMLELLNPTNYWTDFSGWHQACSSFHWSMRISSLFHKMQFDNPELAQSYENDSCNGQAKRNHLDLEIVTDCILSIVITVFLPSCLLLMKSVFFYQYKSELDLFLATGLHTRYFIYKQYHLSFPATSLKRECNGRNMYHKSWGPITKIREDSKLRLWDVKWHRTTSH